MQEAVQTGEMLPERYELEMQKAQEMMMQQLQVAEQEIILSSLSKKWISITSSPTFPVESSIFSVTLYIYGVGRGMCV